MSFLYELLFILLSLILAVTMYNESNNIELNMFSDNMSKNAIYNSNGSNKITTNIVDKEFTITYKELGTFVSSNQVQANVVIEVSSQPDNYNSTEDTLKIYTYDSRTLASLYNSKQGTVIPEDATIQSTHTICKFRNVANGNIDILNHIGYKPTYTVNTYEDLDRNIIYFIH